MTPIRVIIAADYPMVRAGLHALLDSAPEMQVVGQTPLRTAPAVLGREAPDLVVVAPEMSGSRRDDADLLAAFGASPPFGVVLLDDQLDAQAVERALAGGIHALLPRDITADELVAAVRAVASGLVVLHPLVLRLLQRRSGGAPGPEGAPGPDPPTELTAREREVLQLLATGLTNRAIARRLAVSEHTVKFHIGSIFGKLEAASRAEAVSIGVKRGYIRL